MALSTAIPAFAADKYDWTSGGSWDAITFKIKGTKLWGTCMEAGADISDDKGKCYMTKVANDSLWARAVYWMVYEENYYDKDDDRSQAVKCTLQYMAGGSSKEYLKEHYKAAYDAAEERLKDVPSAAAPDNFEMYLCQNLEDDGKAQDFAVWYYTPTGFLKLQKVSGNTGISG